MVKPILWIVGIGSAGANKLTLETYKTLAQADVIFVVSMAHPAVQDMREEGLPCKEIPELATETGIQDAISQIDRSGQKTGEIRNAVLALPGRPFREGRIVTRFQKGLAATFRVDCSLLAGDHSLERLTGIMEELRAVWGCPWDREQTHATLRKYLIEEAYEVIEAIDSQNMNNFCEELGDLLLQVVFHAQIAKEADIFSLDDVLQGISDKLIRRHPHVFGTVIAESSEEVLANWDAIKRAEKSLGKDGAKESEDFFRIPKDLPALMFAEKTQKKAAKIGFDWENYQGPLAKIREELDELEKALGERRFEEEELGDLLFSIVNLARFLNMDAEEVLRQGTKKFQIRFNRMLDEIDKKGLEKEKLSLAEMDFYWDMVKTEEKSGTFGPF